MTLMVRQVSLGLVIAAFVVRADASAGEATNMPCLVRCRGYEVCVRARKSVPVQMHTPATAMVPASPKADLPDPDRAWPWRRRESSGRSAPVVRLPPALPSRLRPAGGEQSAGLLGALAGSALTPGQDAATVGRPSWGWLADSVMATERAKRRAARQQGRQHTAPLSLYPVYGGDLLTEAYSDLIWGGLGSEGK